MSDGTKIEWTDATWNPITGCSIVSPGCTNCYAMKLAGTRLKHHESRAGLTKESRSGPVWTGEVRFNEQWLTQPLKWTKPRMIFVCAHGDLFAEGVPDEWIDQVFAVMALAPQHTFQVLTKRPERMREYLQGERDRRIASRVTDFAIDDKTMMQRMVREVDTTWPVVAEGDPEWPDGLRIRHWPLPNVWLGVSVEDQKRADERIPILLDTPAAIRWISAEPLLGHVDLNSTAGGTLWIGGQRGCGGTHRHSGRLGDTIHGTLHQTDPHRPHHHHDERCQRGIDWVVAGGESGPGARPMHPDWARSLRDQCAAAGVPFLFKQWGEYVPCPWKLVQEPGEGNEAYMARSEDECSRLAVSRAGYIHEMSHAPWSCERVLPAPDSHHAIKKVGKRAAGRLLDGVEHNAFPVPGP